MGEFSRHLLEVNSSSGSPYRLRKRGESSFGMEDLDEARYRVVSMGHEAVMGALERTAVADGSRVAYEGIIKVLPALRHDEIVQLGEAGISAEPVAH